MAQLMPVVPAHLGSPRQRAVKRVCVYDTEAMKPGLKPRVPRPPEKLDKRESLTPRGTKEGHCLYDLEEPFSITLVSVSNVNVVDFSLVITSSLSN